MKIKTAIKAVIAISIGFSLFAGISVALAQIGQSISPWRVLNNTITPSLSSWSVYIPTLNLGSATAPFFTATSSSLTSTFPLASTTNLSVGGNGNLYNTAGETHLAANNLLELMTGSSYMIMNPASGSVAIFAPGGGYLNGLQWMNEELFGDSLSLDFSNGDMTGVLTAQNGIVSNGNVGIGTSSPYAPLSVVGAGGVVADHYIATSTTATSTFANGINLSSKGCYAINGSCLSLSNLGGTISQGWLNSNGTTITSSTSPTVNYITATSTTATSTFAYSIAGNGVANNNNFTPTSVPSLYIWLKADSLALSNGASVAQWTDSSGNNNNAYANNQPTYATNVVNGKPVVRFNGVGNYMSVILTSLLDNNSANSVTQPLTVFFVASSTTSGTGVILFDQATSSGEGTVLAQQNPFRITNDFGHISMDSGGNPIASTTFGVPWPTGMHDYIAAFNTGASSLYYDGQLLAFGDTGGTPMYGLTLGGGRSGGSGTAIDVAEVIVYKRALLPQEIQRIEQYLSNKYAMPYSGPGGTTGPPDLQDWNDASGTPLLSVRSDGSLYGTSIPIISATTTRFLFGTAGSGEIDINGDVTQTGAPHGPWGIGFPGMTDSGGGSIYWGNGNQVNNGYTEAVASLSARYGHAGSIYDTEMVFNSIGDIAFVPNSNANSQGARIQVGLGAIPRQRVTMQYEGNPTGWSYPVGYSNYMDFAAPYYCPSDTCNPSNQIGPTVINTVGMRGESTGSTTAEIAFYSPGIQYAGGNMSQDEIWQGQWTQKMAAITPYGVWGAGGMIGTTSSAIWNSTSTPPGAGNWLVQNSIGIATTSITAALNIGNDPSSSSTTIKMSRIQFDGYDTGGHRDCAFLTPTGWATSTGACTL